MSRSATRRLGGRLAIAFRHDGRVRVPAEWPRELAASARRVDYGEGGALVVAAEGADTAESEATLLFVLGALRGPGGSWRAAADLLAAGEASARRVALAPSTGSALVVAVDRRRPGLAASCTWVAMHPVYWTRTRAGFAAASEPALLLPLLDRVELDEEALPAHFLLRYVAGERTYFRGVRKLLPGHQLTLDAERGEVRVARPLRDVVAGVPRFDGIDGRGVDWLDARLADATARWVEAADARGLGIGNLLSGGLDSSLVQIWLGEAMGSRRRRSYGFAVAAESFQFEVEYAREASRLLGTEHSAPAFGESDFGELLDRAIDLAAEPSFYNESWPGHLRLADFVAAQADGPRVLFTGYGADILNGDSMADAVQRWLWLRRRPRWLARGRAALPRLRGNRRWEAWVEALETSDDPGSLRRPLGHVLLTAEPELLLEAFGAGPLARCYDEIEELEARLFGSRDVLERVHVAQLFATGYDPHVSVTRLYAARGVDLVHLYLDESALAAVFAFPAEVRFVRSRGPWSGRFKPLQQELLRRRGMTSLLGRRKGGTTFGAELWRWLSEGELRDRLAAIERPAWLPEATMARLRGGPSDLLWNLLVFDTWNRRVLRPAAAAAASAARHA